MTDAWKKVEKERRQRDKREITKTLKDTADNQTYFQEDVNLASFNSGSGVGFEENDEGMKLQKSVDIAR